MYVADKSNIKNLQDGGFYRFFNRPVFGLDWTVFLILLVICFLTFIHKDILCTAGSSISYLGGHIKDFYAYNVVNGVEDMNNYMPSTYILFAIWNIPIYILGFVSCPVSDVSAVPFLVAMWYKLLPVIFYIASGFLLGRIGKLLKFKPAKCMLLVFTFLTSPLAFFSPVIFGQYDSFTVFFVILGLYFYFKNDISRFVMFFGLATTFKYFALLIFLPLLLLREKNILKIIKNCLLYAIPFCLECLIYLDSKYFNIGVFGFKVKNYIFQGGLNLNFINIKLFIVFFVFILILAYYKKFGNSVQDNEDVVRWAIYMCNIIVFLLFGLSMWHPQWLIFGVPFMTLGSLINRNAKIFFILDGFLFLVFSILCVVLWRGSVDENLMFNGVLKYFIDFEYVLVSSMSDFCILCDKDILFSCFSGILLFCTVLKHPKFTIKSFSENVADCGLALRFRLFSILLFWILPCFSCILISFIRNNEFLVRNTNYAICGGNVGALTQNRVIQQYFKVPSNIERIEELRVSFDTSDKSSDCVFLLTIRDVTKDAVLFRKEYDAYIFKNIIPTKFNVDGIYVNPKSVYSVSLSLKGSFFDDFVPTINRTVDFEDRKYKKVRKSKLAFGGEYAVIDGEEKPYNICMDIIGS